MKRKAMHTMRGNILESLNEGFKHNLDLGISLPCIKKVRMMYAMKLTNIHNINPRTIYL